MKKLFLLVLIVLFTVFIIGCGGGGGKKDKNEDDNNPILVLNDDFEADTTGNWSLWANESGVKPTNMRVNNIDGFTGYCLNFTSSNCGGNIWNVGCGNTAQFNLKAGKTYTISVKAKSDQPGRFDLVLYNDNPEYEPFYHAAVYTTNTAKVYTVSFTCTINNPTSCFSIQFGNTPNDTNDDIKFYIDEIQISEQTTTTPIMLSGSNLLSNSDFKDALTGWDPPVIVDTFERIDNAPGISGFTDYYLHVMSADCGNAWSSKIIQASGAVNLTPGKTYTITFKACSSSAGLLYAQIWASGGSQYFAYAAGTTTSTQTYTHRFYFNGPASRTASFILQFGNPSSTNTINNNVDFYLDDIKVLEE